MDILHEFGNVRYRGKNLFALMNKGIFRSSLFTLIVRVGGALSALLFQYVLASRIGAGGSGDYYFAVSLILLLSSFGRLGLDRVIPKYVAIAINKDNSKTLIKQVVSACSYVVAASVIIGIISYFLARVTYTLNGNIDLFNAVEIGSILLVFISLNWFFSGVLVGARKAVEASLVQTIVTPFIATVFFVAYAYQLGAFGAILAFGVGNIASCIVGFFFVKNVVSVNAADIRNIKLTSSFDLVTAGLPLMANLLATQLILFLPILLSGYFLSSEETGVFAIAQRTSLTVGFVLFVSNVILAPRVAALWESGNRAAIAELGGMAAVVMSIVCLPILVPLIFFPKLILGIFGEDFTSGHVVLIILACAQLVNVVTSSVEQIMTMTGYQKNVMYTAISCAVGSVFLSILLIPKFGIIGAAISFSATIATLNFWRVYAYWKSTGIDVLPKLNMFIKPVSLIKRLKEF